MKNILYLFIISLIFSCSNQIEPRKNDFSINWFIDYNDRILRKINIAKEEKGNRKGDSTILALANIVIHENRKLITSLTKNNKQRQIQSFVENHHFNSKLDKINIAHYFDLANLHNLSLVEIKRRILMYELQTLSNLSQRIGEEDISFNKLDIYFIPEQYSKLKSKKIRGRLILTAMSDHIGKQADFYFGGNKLREEDGCGVIDLNRVDLADEDSIEIIIKFPNWEIKKSIYIE